MWHSLVPIWTFILGLGTFIYVALDGFDLGIGMLHELVPPADRDTVMSSIGPFWDSNETWLFLGDVSLLAAFPLAFAMAWFRIRRFWVSQVAWKPPACKGRILDTRLFVAGCG